MKTSCFFILLPYNKANIMPNFITPEKKQTKHDQNRVLFIISDKNIFYNFSDIVNYFLHKNQK